MLHLIWSLVVIHHMVATVRGRMLFNMVPQVKKLQSYEMFPRDTGNENEDIYTRKQYFCGDVLTKVVQLICSGVYYQDQPSPFESKRFHFVDPFLRDYAKTKKGISMECCVNPCSLETLRSYCG